MSCYHPLLGLPTGVNESTGKKSIKIVSMSKISSDFSKDPKKEFERIKEMYPGAVLIPCGKCDGCKLDYSREWSNRMLLELEANKGKAVFITLTYNQECVPLAGFRDNGDAYYSLYKPDVQKFLKKLRRHFDGRDDKHPYRKIRYFFAGEYGPKTFRPHYHSIIFGISLYDFQNLEVIWKNEFGDVFYRSDLLERLWFDEDKGISKGFCSLSDVTERTCSYVARYVQKKQFGSIKRIYYENQIPEFSMMSLKPGIGYDYSTIKKYLDQNVIYLGNSKGNSKIPLPDYFLKKKELFSDEERDRIKEVRRMVGESNMLLKLSNTGLGYIDYLETEEQNKLESVKRLYRGDI